MSSLATDQIRTLYEMYQHLMSMDDPSGDIVDLMQQAQDLVELESAIDLSFMSASPKQADLAEAFWTKKYNVLAWVGANRSGKSWGAGRLCMARWIRDRGYPGSRVWCVSQNWKKSVEACQRELWEALPKSNFSKPWSEEYGFGDHAVVTYGVKDPRPGMKKKPGKVTIQFMNEEQNYQVFESSKCDVIWWDEASKESLFGRLLMRLIDKKGQLLISTLPQEMWLKLRIEESGNTKYKHVSFTTYDNEPNLPKGAIDELSSGLSPEEKRMRIFGEYVSLSGLCFPEFVNVLYPEGHISETPTELPTSSEGECCYDLFIDPGVHTSALLLVVTPEGRKIVWDEVYVMGKRVDEIADMVRDMLKSWGITVAGLNDIAMDPAGWAMTPSNELTLADEYQKHGIPVRRWLRTKDFGGGERAMINITRNAFKNYELLVNDKCHNTIKELRTWRWVMDDTQRIDIRERPASSDNHSCDVIKAWMAESPGTSLGVSGVYDTAEDLELDPNVEPYWQEQMV